MGIIRVQNRFFDIDCIIFDKDGTLIDFDAFWGLRTKKWFNLIAASHPSGSGFRKELCDMLGYDDAENHVRFGSPLFYASMDTLYTLAAGVIAKHDLAWYQARVLAEESARSTMCADPNPDEIIPRGNLLKVIGALKEANVEIAVATNDDREMTANTLSQLGVGHLVSMLICGDDPVPDKPNPDAAWEIGTQLGIKPERMMMVGDSISDMQFAANAGIGFRVGVASDAETAAALAPHADAVVSSIDEFSVLPLIN